MRKTITIISALIIFQACSIFHSMLGHNKCITNFYCETGDNCSKYSLHTMWSSDILYLTKDSLYYYESQGEGRGALFSFGEFEINDSTLTLKHNEEKTRKYILDYKSNKANKIDYTPFMTLDFLESSDNRQKIKQEIPAYFIFDNYYWKITTNKKLEKKLRGYNNFVKFELEKLNGLVMINDTLLSPGIHIINGKKYKVKTP